MDEALDIIVTGFEVPDRLAEAGLVRVFGLDAQRARRFVRGLPVVAKRCPNAGAAERYVSALRSIGARVELRTAEDDDAPERNSSLPIPAPSALAYVDRSARVESATARAVARFRAAEGLDDTDSGLIDPVNPRIPKAPRLPRDLARMPNATPMRGSERPEWMLDDPLVQSAADAGAPSAPEAQTPVVTPNATSTPPLRPSGATIGLAHAARASVRPGLGLLASWRPGGVALQRWRKRDLVAPTVLLAALVGAALWWTGLFDSDADRRAQALRARGIDPGVHTLAAGWVDQPGRDVRGIDAPALHDLLGKLARAGAVAVFALRIQPSNSGETAAALLIQLPDQPAARRTILWHAAQARKLQPPLIADPGGPYYVLEFSK